MEVGPTMTVSGTLEVAMAAAAWLPAVLDEKDVEEWWAVLIVELRQRRAFARGEEELPWRGLAWHAIIKIWTKIPSHHTAWIA